MCLRSELVGSVIYVPRGFSHRKGFAARLAAETVLVSVVSGETQSLYLSAGFLYNAEVYYSE